MRDGWILNMYLCGLNSGGRRNICLSREIQTMPDCERFVESGCGDVLAVGVEVHLRQLV